MIVIVAGKNVKGPVTITVPSELAEDPEQPCAERVPS